MTTGSCGCLPPELAPSWSGCAEERLRESEAQARHLLESNFDGIVLVTDGRIAYANRALWKLAGCQSAEDMVGTSPADFIVPEQREAVREQMANTLTGDGKLAPAEFLGVKIDGSTMPVEVLGRRIAFQGKPAILAAVRSITARKQTERLYAESERLRSLGQLAAGVAHNFNNALTTISGHSELLALRADVSDDIRRELKLIECASDQAAELTHQLVAFSHSAPVQSTILSVNEAAESVSKLDPLRPDTDRAGDHQPRPQRP